MVHFFHEGGGPYLKGEKPLTPSSISNTGLIYGVPPLSANEPLRFVRIIYMGQTHKSNTIMLRSHPALTANRHIAGIDQPFSTTPCDLHLNFYSPVPYVPAADASSWPPLASNTYIILSKFNEEGSGLDQ